MSEVGFGAGWQSPQDSLDLKGSSRCFGDVGSRRSGVSVGSARTRRCKRLSRPAARTERAPRSTEGNLFRTRPSDGFGGPGRERPLFLGPSSCAVSGKLPVRNSALLSLFLAPFPLVSGYPLLSWFCGLSSIPLGSRAERTQGLLQKRLASLQDQTGPFSTNLSFPAAAPGGRDLSRRNVFPRGRAVTLPPQRTLGRGDVLPCFASGLFKEILSSTANKPLLLTNAAFGYWHLRSELGHGAAGRTHSLGGCAPIRPFRFFATEQAAFAAERHVRWI